MSSLKVLEPLFRFLPEVKSPVHHEDFNEKLKWTALILVLYFILTEIPLYGLSSAAVDQFAQLRAVMAGSFGSILTLGIGPIVTASIVLQLLVGSKLLDLDLSSPEDKSQYQATQKILSIVFTMFEAGVLVLTGSLVPIDNSYLGVLFLQLVIGAILIIYLDEVISKWGFGSGIGLFIAFIGLQNAGLVQNSDSTLVTITDFTQNFHTAGITALLAVIGVFITAILVLKEVKGNILWGILITWLLGIICQFTGLYVPNAEIGYYSLLPDFSAGLSIPSLAPIFMKLDFTAIPIAEFVVIIFAFLFVDIFDTLGTLIGVASKADMLDEEGRLPRIKGALMADAVATTAGAVMGTSTTTTFVESASGVTEGGRTGLTSMTTAILFLLSLLLSPVFLAIPSFATAPALIIVGFYMVNQVGLIDFTDYAEGIPAFICIAAMPFFYSISEGISMGVISYVVLNLVSGKAKEKKISPVMYVLAVMFLLKYVLI